MHYSFWFYKSKLEAILLMIASLVKYDLDEAEKEVIYKELAFVNPEKDWLTYLFKGLEKEISINLTLDSDDNDIVIIKIIAPIELKEKIEALSLFQSLFSELKV